MMRYCTALVAVFATVSAISGAGSAQDFMAEPGAPAAAFPKADRPVANIVSPVWHDEKERDAAGEPVQFVRLLGIKSGVTIADIALDAAMRAIDYAGFPARKTKAKAEGKLRGIGVSCYVEACGIAPSKAVGSLGAGVGLRYGSTRSAPSRS